MHLIENRDKLRGFAKYLAYIFVVPVGLLLDALLNLVVCMIFLKIPQDKLTTGTLRRYMGDDSYRGKMSVAICMNLLNPYDSSGSHCKNDQ